MKLRRHIIGQEVVVLIDNGATHNFMLLSLVPTLGLTIKRGDMRQRVMLGNGHFDKSFGICK